MTTDEDSPLLRLDGVKTYFPEGNAFLRRLWPATEIRQVRAVDDVTLDLRPGETLGLVGESGCGKSTLARTALRLLTPTEGRIYYRGEDITEYDQSQLRAFRSEAQMVFQDPFASLNPRYTVERTLVEPMSVHGIGHSRADRIGRAAALLDRVGLEEDHLDRHPHEFSGGQRQRIAIARALAVEPDLLVADEPTSALDVSIQAQILRLLASLKDEMGLTMLFITHDLGVVRRVADRVAVMYLGELVETAPTVRLFSEPDHPYTAALLSSIPIPDPTVERDRIHLEGDVPTPVDPPAGCRFHPRCPAVIPPEGWQHDQRPWRRVLQFKKRLEKNAIEPTAKRTQLEAARGDSVTDETVVNALYEEHVTRSAIADVPDVTLPEPAEETVKEALTRLVDGDRADAIAMLNESFRTVCETRTPRVVEPADGRTVMCHLHDPDVDARPGSLVAPEPIRSDTDSP